MKKNIFIILPYKESLNPSKAGGCTCAKKTRSRSAFTSAMIPTTSVSRNSGANA